MVRAHGSSSPALFFIADAPHGKDFETNFALDGHAGNTLRNYCREVNLNLDSFWRTCFIKEELPKIDDKNFSKTNALIDQYAPLLMEEINDLKPQMLVPLNEHVFKYLTGLTSIRKYRGSVLPPIQRVDDKLNIRRPNTKILPILGPYPYLIQEYKLNAITRIDFTKIPKNLNDGPIPDNYYSIWVCRNSGAFRNYLDRMRAKNPSFLVFDIETYAQIPVCIGFCFDGYESVCVPLTDPHVDRDNRALMMMQIDQLLRSRIPKKNQNIKYDWKILERWGFRVNNIVGDSQLASSVLYCEFPKNLGFLTSIYTDLPYHKDEGKAIDPDKNKKDRLYLYCAKDCLATWQVCDKQEKELDELNVRPVYNNVMTCVPIYRRMEDKGIRRDEEQRIALQAKYESLYRIQLLKLKSLLNTSYFNPLSSKQVHSAVFDELGFSKVQGMGTSKKTGKVKLDEENLELLVVNGEAKRAPSTGKYVLSSIIGARKLHKCIEFLNLILHPDNRIRGEYNLGGAETGRSTSSETTDQIIMFEDEDYRKQKVIFSNLGHGLQTFAKHGFMIDGLTYGKDLRKVFVPDYGYVFVEIDLKGAEARVDRVLSGNFDLAVFDNPGIHKFTGAMVYKCSPADIKKGILVDGVDRYHMSKTIRHAGERNMGEDRLVMMTQRPKLECKALLFEFHAGEPNIRNKFHRDIKEAIDKTRCLIAPNGRRRDFFDRIDKRTYNEGISQLPQSIVSDQTKFFGIGLTYEDPAVYEYADLLNEAHDGSLHQVKKERAYDFARLYKSNIESVPIDFRSGSLIRDFVLTIPAEVSMSEENWFSMEEVEI